MSFHTQFIIYQLFGMAMKLVEEYFFFNGKVASLCRERKGKVGMVFAKSFSTVYSHKKKEILACKENNALA